MASRPKITGRVTSLAAAFVHAIIPRRVDAAEQAQLFRRVGINEAECVYCGALATDKDHLRAIVKGGRPSGHFHTTDNLVPSCGPCNQSKGGADWNVWMKSAAKGSPATKGVPDIEERIQRLERFEREAGVGQGMSQAPLREAVGAERWDSYWQRLEDLKTLMAEAQREAAEIEAVLSRSVGIH